MRPTSSEPCSRARSGGALGSEPGALSGAAETETRRVFGRRCYNLVQNSSRMVAASTQLVQRSERERRTHREAERLRQSPHGHAHHRVARSNFFGVQPAILPAEHERELRTGPAVVKALCRHSKARERIVRPSRRSGGRDGAELRRDLGRESVDCALFGRPIVAVASFGDAVAPPTRKCDGRVAAAQRLGQSVVNSCGVQRVVAPVGGLEGRRRRGRCGGRRSQLDADASTRMPAAASRRERHTAHLSRSPRFMAATRSH